MTFIKYIILFIVMLSTSATILLVNRIVLGTFKPSTYTLLFCFAWLIASINIRMYHKEIDKILKDAWEA